MSTRPPYKGVVSERTVGVLAFAWAPFVALVSEALLGDRTTLSTVRAFVDVTGSTLAAWYAFAGPTKASSARRLALAAAALEGARLAMTHGGVLATRSRFLTAGAMVGVKVLVVSFLVVVRAGYAYLLATLVWPFVCLRSNEAIDRAVMICALWTTLPMLGFDLLIVSRVPLTTLSTISAGGFVMGATFLLPLALAVVAFVRIHVRRGSPTNGP